MACDLFEAGYTIYLLYKDEMDMDAKKKIMFAFGLLMMLVYWGMAFLLAFSSLFEERIDPVWRYGMGIIFFIYGCFRAYRQFKRGVY